MSHAKPVLTPGALPHTVGPKTPPDSAAGFRADAGREPVGP